MRNKSFTRLVSLVVSALFFCATFAQAAEGPKYAAARHEAFVKGGNAITEALNYKDDTKLPVSSVIEESVPPVPAAAGAPQAGRENNRMAAWKYGALAAGFTVMGILLYHWAVGPGASIRNCSTCSK